MSSYLLCASHISHTYLHTGLVSMVSSGVHRNASQFYISTEACPHLNGRAVVFGRVIEGMEVVKKVGRYLAAYIPTYIRTYQPTNQPTYRRTHLPTYLPTYLQVSSTYSIRGRPVASVSIDDAGVLKGGSSSSS